MAPVVVWGKQAENCSKYLKKGRPVFVEGDCKLGRGKIRMAWQTLYNGSDRTKCEIYGQRRGRSEGESMEPVLAELVRLVAVVWMINHIVVEEAAVDSKDPTAGRRHPQWMTFHFS